MSLLPLRPATYSEDDGETAVLAANGTTVATCPSRLWAEIVAHSVNATTGQAIAAHKLMQAGMA
jgi:hypothetical protein